MWQIAEHLQGLLGRAANPEYLIFRSLPPAHCVSCSIVFKLAISKRALHEGTITPRGPLLVYYQLCPSSSSMWIRSELMHTAALACGLHYSSRPGTVSPRSPSKHSGSSHDRRVVLAALATNHTLAGEDLSQLSDARSNTSNPSAGRSQSCCAGRESVGASARLRTSDLRRPRRALPHIHPTGLTLSKAGSGQSCTVEGDACARTCGHRIMRRPLATAVPYSKRRLGNNSVLWLLDGPAQELAFGL